MLYGGASYASIEYGGLRRRHTGKVVRIKDSATMYEVVDGVNIVQVYYIAKSPINRLVEQDSKTTEAVSGVSRARDLLKANSRIYGRS